MATLLRDIEEFAAEHGLSEYAFGERALNDRHLVRQLRAGRELRRKTEQKVRNFMLKIREGNSATSDVALCSRCDVRADNPSVKSCTSPQCPMRAQEAA